MKSCGNVVTHNRMLNTSSDNWVKLTYIELPAMSFQLIFYKVCFFTLFSKATLNACSTKKPGQKFGKNSIFI